MQCSKYSIWGKGLITGLAGSQQLIIASQKELRTTRACALTRSNTVFIFLGVENCKNFYSSNMPMSVCKFHNYINCKQSKFEPQHVISNNVVCATNKASDQSAHVHSLIRAFASHLNIL